MPQSDNDELMQRLEEVQEELKGAAAIAMAELRGMLLGNGPPTPDQLWLAGMFARVLEELLGDQRGATDSRQLRALLVDLLELAPDPDHCEYPADKIEELKQRARQFLIG